MVVVVVVEGARVRGSRVMDAIHEHKEPVLVATFIARNERATAREKARAAAGQHVVLNFRCGARRIIHSGAQRNKGGTTTVSQRVAGRARGTVLDIGGSTLLVHMMLFKCGARLSDDIGFRDAVFLARALRCQV